MKADWQAHEQTIIDGLYARQALIDRELVLPHIIPPIDLCIDSVREYLGIGADSITPAYTDTINQDELEKRVSLAIRCISPIAEQLREETTALTDRLEAVFDEPEDHVPDHPHDHIAYAAIAHAAARAIHYGLDPSQKQAFNDAVQLKKQADNLFRAYSTRHAQIRKRSGS